MGSAFRKRNNNRNLWAHRSYILTSHSFPFTDRYVELLDIVKANSLVSILYIMNIVLFSLTKLADKSARSLKYKHRGNYRALDD